MRINNIETSVKAWGWKLLCGPASVVDGIVETISFGMLSAGLKLAVSRRLAMARIGR